MNNSEITSYIQTQLAAGHDVNTIATQLRSSGWAEKDIQASFAALPNVAAPLQAPVATQTIAGKQMTPEMIEKQKKYALIAGIASIVLFFILFFVFKYVFVAVGLVGLYAGIAGIRTKSIPPVILGFIGAALNFIAYIASAFIN